LFLFFAGFADHRRRIVVTHDVVVFGLTALIIIVIVVVSVATELGCVVVSRQRVGVVAFTRRTYEHADQTASSVIVDVRLRPRPVLPPGESPETTGHSSDTVVLCAHCSVSGEIYQRYKSVPRGIKNAGNQTGSWDTASDRAGGTYTELLKLPADK